MRPRYFIQQLQRRFFSNCLSFLILMLASLFASQTIAIEPHKSVRQESLSQRDRALRQAAERRFLQDRQEEIVERQVGDYVVDREQTVRGDLVVTSGRATIVGQVQGTVLVVRGDAVLDSASHVHGDVVSVGGRIERHPDSLVDGDMVETSIDALRNGHREWREDKDNEPVYRRLRAPWRGGYEEPFVVHYNRVDGSFLGPRLPRTYGDGQFFNFGLYGFGGYGFASKAWQYQLGGELHFELLDRMTIGLEAQDMTVTEDEWIIPEDENSLAAFFIREDFRDYYRKDGFSAYVSQRLGSLALTGAYHENDLESLKKETNWSLFGGGKRFRNNPLIDEGRMVSLNAGLAFDTRNHPRRPQQGWLIALQGEFSRPDYDSDFDFDRFIIDLRRYQPLNWGQNLDLRLRVGSSRGQLPSQYLFDLGGISTLRAFDFKSFTGDRMVLGNLEYRLSAKHGRRHDVWFLEPFNLIFFIDSGLAWFANDASKAGKSFDYLTWRRLKTNIGFAITDEDGRVRLNFAKRTDVGGEGLVVTFRLNRDF